MNGWLSGRNRIELNASPLGSTLDHSLDFHGAEQLQRECEDESLGDRLDGEKNAAAVADLVDMAIDGHRQADAEMVRIGLFQLGNVVYERTAIVPL